MRAALLVLLAACSPVDPDRPAPPLGGDDGAAPVVPARDARGCWEGGPCIDEPPDAGIFRWDGTGTFCVSGTGFGEAPGRLLWAARERAASSWSDTEVCIAAGDEEPSALVQVERADGRRSNREAVVTPPLELTWDLPDVVRTGDVIVGRGRNLGGFGFDNSGETWHRVAPPGRSMSLAQADGTSLDVVVHPDLVLPCVTTAAEPCAVGARGLDPRRQWQADPDGYRATLAGRAAPILDWYGQKVVVAWPEGLSPGVHELVVTQPDGTSDALDVTLLAGTRVDLATTTYTLPVFRDLISRVADDPVLLDGDLWFTGERGDLFNTGTRLNPGRVRPDDGGWEVRRGIANRASALTVPDWGGLPWLVHADALRPLVEDDTRSDPLFVEDSARGAIRGDGPDDLLAWHVSGDLLLLASKEGVAQRPRVEGWRLVDGEPERAWAPVQVGGAARVPFHDSPGIWMSDDGAWTGPCNNVTGSIAQDLWFTPWTLGAEGPTEGTPVRVFAGGADARILACRLTDGGLVFVAGPVRDGSVREATVYHHRPGRPLDVLATLDERLPGLPAAVDDGAGRTPIESVALGDDGRVVLLLADRTSRPHTLSLAAWDGATWAVGEAFGTRFPDLQGDRCVGPTLCEGSLQDGHAEVMGCVPQACPVQTESWLRWDSVQVWRAGMALDGERAWVTWQAVRGPARPYGDSGASYTPHGAFLEAVAVP